MQSIYRCALKAQAMSWFFLFFLLSIALCACDSESSQENGDGGIQEGILKCPKGSVRKNDHCVFPCPEGWHRNSEGKCEPPCIDGWSKMGDVCGQPCPGKMEAVDGGPLCRVPENDVGPVECTGSMYDITGSENSDQIIYVNAVTGSDTGDGSEELPFDTLNQALDSINSVSMDVSIIFSEGTYSADPMDFLSVEVSSLHFLGSCADDVRIDLSSGDWQIEKRDLSLEIGRITIADGKLNVSEADQIHIHDSFFDGSLSGSDGIMWNSSEGNGSITVERNVFYRNDYGIYIYTGLSRGEIRYNIFNACTSEAICIQDFEDLLVQGNSFINAGQTALSVGYGSTAQSALRITENWIYGAEKTGIFIDQWNGSAEIMDNAISGTAGAPVWIDSSSSINFSGNRIMGEGASGFLRNGLILENSNNITVSENIVFGAGENGIHVKNSEKIFINSSYIGASGNSAIRSEMNSKDVNIEQCVISGNGTGIDANEGDIKILNTLIGSCGLQGIRLRKVSGLDVEGNTIAGTGSTGLDLTLLEGSSSDVYLVENNYIHESVGLGIVIRSGGPGTVEISGNRVLGTRPGTITNARTDSTVGDGIAVLTGTDNIGSHATMSGNNISGNIRVGIIVHGSGTSAQVSNNTYGSGNGYGNYINELSGKDAEIVEQAEADVSGGDVSRAFQPSESLPVANDVSLGGGGDPR